MSAITDHDLLDKSIKDGHPLRVTMVGRDIVIRASKLRSLLIRHTTATTLDEKSPTLNHSGIQIDGRTVGQGQDIGSKVRIVPDDGEACIDLSNLASSEANPLPALSLIGCQIEAPLVLRGSHFARITLDHCQIVQIDADHVQVDSHFSMKHLRPYANHSPPRAQVRMIGARVSGHLDVRGSKLVSAPLNTDDEMPVGSYADRFALSLSSARIGGRVIFDGGFTALGGISLYQAVLQGSLHIGAAQFESIHPSLPALDAEEVRINGSFIWHPKSPSTLLTSQSWHIAGALNLKRCRISGDVILSGSTWATAGAASLRGTDWLVDHIQGGIDLRLAHIGGQLEIKGKCTIMRQGAAPSRKYEDDVDRSLFGPSIDAWKSRIDNGVRISERSMFYGPVYFGNSVIGNGYSFSGTINFDLSLAAIDRYPEAIDISDARISGPVRLEGSVAGVVSLRRSNVQGSLHLRNLNFRTGLLTLGDRTRDREGGFATLLDLGELIVAGGVHIFRVTLFWEKQRQNGLHELRRINIPKMFTGRYDKPNGQIVYVLDGKFELSAIRRRGVLSVLDGSLSSFSKLVPNTLNLTTPDEVEAYFRLYCENTRGKLGEMAILEIGPISKIDDEWKISATKVAYGNQCYEGNFIVKPNAERFPSVYAKKSKLVANTVNIAGDSYHIGPINVLAKERPAPSLKDSSPEEIEELADAYAQYLSTIEFRPTYIDLRGLKCRSFDDMGGMAWGACELALGKQFQWRLLLDGIEFDILGVSGPAKVSTIADRRQELNLRIGMLLAFCDIEQHDPKLAMHLNRISNKNDDSQDSFLSQTVRRPSHKLIDHASQHKSFSPQPIEMFAHAYFVNGDRRASSRLMKITQDIEWNRRAKSRIPMGKKTFLQSLLYPFRICESYIVTSIGYIYGTRFGYGLSPRRALVTMTLGLVLGFAISIFNVKAGTLKAWGETEALEAKKEGCKVVGGGVTDVFLYTVDSYIPLIDMHKECTFHIAPSSKWSSIGSIADFAISLIGWICSSLALVTMTGLVRRFPRG